VDEQRRHKYAEAARLQKRDERDTNEGQNNAKK
jgi:hypothetical protein